MDVTDAAMTQLDITADEADLVLFALVHFRDCQHVSGDPRESDDAARFARLIERLT